jgi:exoribonuclease R
VAKRAYSIRLEERVLKILEELGKEIPRQTPYPESTVTQMIERAIEDYLGRLEKEKEQYKELMFRINKEFAIPEETAAKSYRRQGKKVLRINRPGGRGAL